MNTRVLLLLLSIAVVFADHFDYAGICWKRTAGDENSQRSYEFTVYEGFQRIWKIGNGGWPSPPNVGDTLDAAQTELQIFPMAGSNPNPTIEQHLDLKATVVQNQGPDVEQWVIGKKTFTLQTSANTDKNWRFFYEANARKADLQDGNGQVNGQTVQYRFQGVINRFDDHSICAVSGIPYLYLDFQVPNILSIPVLNDLDEDLLFGISKTTESKLNVPYPLLPTQPNGQDAIVTTTDKTKPEFRLNKDTGIWTWTPQVKGDYAVQFFIEKVCDASEGTTCTDTVNQANCCSRTILDILLKVVDPDAAAPSFTDPFDQDVTDPDQRKLFVPEGVQYTKQICVDKTGATIYSSELPAGATLTPSASSPAGKTCYDFTWASPNADAIVCFGSAVGTGANYKVNHGQYCIKFIVRRKVTLTVYNLPKTDKAASDLPVEKFWYAFPSTPNDGWEDVLQIRVTTSVPHTGDFELWGKFEPYKTPNNPWVLHGTAKVTKVQTQVDGLVDMLVYTLPWGVKRIGNWQMIVNATSDEHHQKANLLFNQNFHFFPNDGRWLAPSTVQTGKNFFFYTPTWEADNAYSSFLTTINFLGWTAGHGADLKCGYNQVLNPSSNGPHNWYRFTGAPVLKDGTDVNFAGSGGALPYLHAKKFAILTLVDGDSPTPAQVSPGPTAFARVFAQYCIDTKFFKTLK